MATYAGVNIALPRYNLVLLHFPDNAGHALAERVEKELACSGTVYALRERLGDYAFVIGGEDVDRADLMRVLEPLRETLTAQQASWHIGQPVESCLRLADVYRECLMEKTKIPPPVSENAPLPAERDSDAYLFQQNGVSEVGMTPLIQHTIDIMIREFRSTLSLNIIAQRLNASPNYLGFLFHQNTGSYFSDYLNSLRINEAKRLLTETDESIDDISLAVGYSNVNYFYRVFKSISGQSPNQFRKGSHRDE